jgi:hypothetical protein
MNAIRCAGLVGVAFALITAPLAGQATGVQGGGGQRPPANQSGQGGQRGQANQTVQNRAQREQALRVNLARQLKERLQLTDDQMTKLMAVNQRLDGARRELFDRERATRNSLRTELSLPDAQGTQVREARVGELLDQLIRLQQERLGLVEREQVELKSFLTNVQRARYQAFTDQLQRRMDEMDGGRDGRDGRGGGPGGPGGRGGRGRGGPPPPAGTGAPPPTRTPPPMR